MNSRDRLRSGDLRDAIERELEILIKDHQGLRELRERRRREEIESKISDSKPLEKALELILKSSPSLLSLFSVGTRLSNPFKTMEVASTDKPFKGKYRPTYFKFQKLPYGQRLERKVAINMRCRIVFETDVVNDYFSRLQNKGTFTLRVLSNGQPENIQSYSLNLQNGRATLSLKLPESFSIGDMIEYEAKVTDGTLVDPFINRFVLSVSPQQQPQGDISERSKPPVNRNGKMRELPGGVAIPEVFEVFESDWEYRKPKFDQYSALQIIQEEAVDEDTTGNGSSALYSFWVNMDNIYFKTECKYSKEDPKILKARWKYGLTLLGMALIQADAKAEKSTTTEETKSQIEEEEALTIEQRVFQTSSAVAPVLLPIIETLGSLTEEQVVIGSQVGDDE